MNIETKLEYIDTKRQMLYRQLDALDQEERRLLDRDVHLRALDDLPPFTVVAFDRQLGSKSYTYAAVHSSTGVAWFVTNSSNSTHKSVMNNGEFRRFLLEVNAVDIRVATRFKSLNKYQSGASD